MSNQLRIKIITDEAREKGVSFMIHHETQPITIYIGPKETVAWQKMWKRFEDNNVDFDANSFCYALLKTATTDADIDDTITYRYSSAEWQILLDAMEILFIQ